MKIKIIDDFVHEYEDVTQGEVYEVVEGCLMDYVIIDDQFDKNAIDKEHCEIVTDDVIFKEGDHVKFINPDYTSYGKDFIVISNQQGQAVEAVEGVEFSPIVFWAEDLILVGSAKNDGQRDIITEGDMFKKGDRVKINSKNMDELVGWHVVHKVNSEGVVQEYNGGEYLVLTDDDNLVWFVSKERMDIIEDAVKEDHAEEPTKSPSIDSLQQILTFTRDMKGFEVSFEEGKVTVKDWNIDYDCVEYVLDSIDDLEPMMESISHIQSFKK